MINSRIKRSPRRDNKRRKKVRKRFIAVDVWQTQFGDVSVRAVYDVYSQKFNVELHNMKNYSFSHCVNALRKLEDSDYKEPVNMSRDDASYVKVNH